MGENHNRIGKRRNGLDLITSYLAETREDGDSVYQPGDERCAPAALPLAPFLQMLKSVRWTG